MNELNYPETTKHVIIHNGVDVYSYIVIEPCNCISSGQPFMEIFESKEEAKQSFPQAFPNPILENVENSYQTESVIDFVTTPPDLNINASDEAILDLVVE